LSLLCLDRSRLLARGLEVAGRDEDAVIAAVASVPLTADPWEPLPEATLLALSLGREVGRVDC